MYTVSRLSGMVPILWPARDNAADSTVRRHNAKANANATASANTLNLPFVLPTCSRCKPLPDWLTVSVSSRPVAFSTGYRCITGTLNDPCIRWSLIFIPTRYLHLSGQLARSSCRVTTPYTQSCASCRSRTDIAHETFDLCNSSS